MTVSESIIPKTLEEIRRLAFVAFDETGEGSITSGEHLFRLRRLITAIENAAYEANKLAREIYDTED